MKKLFFVMAAVAALLTSCSKDDTFGGLSHGKVTFEVSTPELATRAYGDGQTANNLYYAVYDVTENGAMVKTNYNDTTEDDVQLSNLKATVTIDLVEGRKYEVAFWAESPNSPYTFDADNKTVSYKKTNNLVALVANKEDYDAFFAYVPEDKVVVGSNVSVTLKRPFAQLNIATNDTQKASDLGVTVKQTGVKVYAYTSFDLKSGDVIGEKKELTFDMKNVGDDTATEVVEHTLGTITANNNNYDWLTMNYILVNERENIDITFLFEDNKGKTDYTRPYAAVPVQRNYRTNVIGSILTDPTDFNVEINPGIEINGTIEHEIIEVNNASDLAAVFEDLNDDDSTNDPSSIIFTDDINLNDLFAMSSQSSATYSAVTRASTDPTITIAKGKKLSIDLNGKKLSATSSQTGQNYNMFNVLGTLTVVNGTMEYKHLGENMGWGSSTNLFNVTDGGVLNLERVTAKNLGGSDMGFVAHLNNWGEVTLNVENSTLESNYVAVRVFNSGNDMNNVTIKKSTLKGNSAAFWVHNYTVADFGAQEKADAQKALLNLNIYNQDNTFSPDVNGIRYGFTNSIRTDSYGITKSVSEDGTEVTLGYFFDDNKGLIRRGVAGDEENTTITKVVVEEGIETLYDRTFRRYYALETVELPSTLTTIGAAGSGVFQSCTALKNIVIPESVTVLGKGSFQECSSLESINIPAGVTRIEESSLRATGLKEIEFHAGVTYFGAQAFRDCKQLTKVVINAPEFTMEGNTFGIMAAPFTPMTIYVANAEMKTYVESKLTDHAKTYITVVVPEVANVSTAAEFIEAVKNVKEEGTITLDSNIEFNEEDRTNNGGWWDGLYYVGDKSFTIDLNGHSISQNGALNDYLLNFKNAGTKENTITIKNGTLDAGTTAFCALCTSGTQENQLTINLENVTLYNNISNGSTAKIRGGAILNVNAGTKIIGKDSYLGIENWASTVNIYDGAEIYMNGTSSYNGCLVGVGGNGTINVYGGYGKGVSGGLIAMTSGGTINVSGGEWIANTDGTYANSNKSVLIAQSDKQYNAGAGNAVVNVTGGTFKGGYNCYGNAVGDAQINISRGNFNADPSGYLAEGCLTLKDNNNIWTVMSSTLESGEYDGTLEFKGDLIINGDVTIKTLKATNGGTITIADDKTLTLNNFSFGSKDNASAEYEIKGGTVVANYGFFQHGKYELRSNFETGYMYYSYGSDITVYGTFHSQGKGDGLDYVRGKLTIAKGGKSLHDKSLWVGQPASWGAMAASLIIEDGGYVQANSLSVYEGSSLTYYNDADLKYNSLTGTITKAE